MPDSSRPAPDPKPAPDTTAETTPQAEPVSATPNPGGDDSNAWRRLFRTARPRATKANALTAILALLLGLAIAAPVQITSSRGLEQLSQSDLVQVLDEVTQRTSRLNTQIQQLQATKNRLTSGNTAEALTQAKGRLETLQLLAGSVPAEGPGVTITIEDPQHAVDGTTILSLIQELRDAGAEVIQVGPARIVASSGVGLGTPDVTIDGQSIPRPFVIKAIGQPETLSTAMTIPGGIVESIKQQGGTATVTQAKTLRIDALHSVTVPRYALPIPDPTAAAPTP